MVNVIGNKIKMFVDQGVLEIDYVLSVIEQNECFCLVEFSVLFCNVLLLLMGIVVIDFIKVQVML